ncbi:MAG TPA: sterol desaturase family protein [Ohtaekwangia sp.]|nr:sterol desaturase family protein [Ohtaekwangia sp.]
MEHLLYFLSKDFWQSPWLVLLFTTSLFVVVLIRYLLAAYIYGLVLTRWIRRKAIAGNHSDLRRRHKEIRWAVVSSAIFSVLAALTWLAYQYGLTRVYTEIHTFGITYFIFSIILMLFLYETYYYWLHRWMHKPGIFRIVHRVHHQSVHTSVFTSFSFHPLEAILQFIFLPVMVMIIPVHYAAIAIVLLLMTISAVVNHAGVEIYPENFVTHRIGRWLIGATHHDIHHKDFRKNFGLYFTFWDKWMNTESEKFPEEFSRNTGND